MSTNKITTGQCHQWAKLFANCQEMSTNVTMSQCHWPTNRPTMSAVRKHIINHPCLPNAAAACRQSASASAAAIFAADCNEPEQMPPKEPPNTAEPNEYYSTPQTSLRHCSLYPESCLSTHCCIVAHGITLAILVMVIVWLFVGKAPAAIMKLLRRQRDYYTPPLSAAAARCREDKRRLPGESMSSWSLVRRRRHCLI